MLVVVASRHDAAARALCERAPPGSAQVLAWRDLSTRGWCHFGDPDDGADTAVLGGAPIDVSEITAVVTRCPSVPPHELSHIIPADRDYVAAEMTATLLAWLARLRCPVVNPPIGSSLSGPRWHPECWVALATSLGLRALPLARRAVHGLAPTIPRATAPTGCEHRAVTVVGARAIELRQNQDGPRPELADEALALAHAAGIALLRAEFAIRGVDHWFLGADANVDLAAAPVADALLDHVGLAAAEPVNAVQ